MSETHTHSRAHVHNVQFGGNKTICCALLLLASGLKGSVSARIFGTMGTFQYNSRQTIVTIIEKNALVKANTGYNAGIKNKRGEKKDPVAAVFAYVFARLAAPAAFLKSALQ